MFSKQLAISVTKENVLFDQNLIWKPVHETDEEGTLLKRGYRLPEVLPDGSLWYRQTLGIS